MKGLNIHEWTTVYIPAVRKHNVIDGENIVCFTNDMWDILLNDDQFLTEEELKAKFNEWLPKQGDMIEVRHDEWDYEWEWDKRIFVSFYKWKVIVDDGDGDLEYWGTWRIPKQKTELTLAEVEERLGLDAWSLVIK